MRLICMLNMKAVDEVVTKLWIMEIFKHEFSMITPPYIKWCTWKLSCTCTCHADHYWWVSWKSVQKWGRSSHYEPKLLYFLCSRGDNSTLHKVTHMKIMSCTSACHADHFWWVSWKFVQKCGRSSRYKVSSHTNARRTSSWLQYTPLQTKFVGV